MIAKQQVKNEQIKKNGLALCVLQMCLNSNKTSSRSFKRILGNKNYINKKDFLKKPLVTMIIA